MNENLNKDIDYETRTEERRQRRKKRRRRSLIGRAIFLIVFVLLIAAASFVICAIVLNRDGPGLNFRLPRSGSAHTQSGGGTTDTSEGGTAQTGAAAQTETAAQTEMPQTETQPPADYTGLLKEADLMAQGYDYEGAIALLRAVPDYQSSDTLTQAISGYEKSLSECVAVDVTTVPHIFYHSLLNDPASAFDTEVLGQFAVDGMNAWMTTVEEFDKITQQMYDNGYVFVRLRDLVTETTDADGNVHFEPNTSLLLPPDKKAVVLSVDDLSYYHSYEMASFPDKLVLDGNGQVKCHYVRPDGTEEVGDFDVVPRLNTFLTEHPDGAYKGARGMIAMTGYNGVFGYRTDADYELREHLMDDQSKWLDAHPDFNRQAEIAEATKIADALKAEGWEFASHTWGHLSVTNKTVDELRNDNEKWIANVQNIVGPVDTIIFAHGNDIGDWQDYGSDNEKYQYFKSAGYNFFCNVDGSQPYWVQIRDEYVRQGRINLDGYMLYQSSQGNTTVLDNMFKASQVFDSRRPTPVVANGEG